METPIIMNKKLLQKEYDREKYFRDVDKSRRTKIVQKIKREGSIPTETSINKYNITIEEIITILEYLKDNTQSVNLEKTTNTLNKRIKYIKEKGLKDKENNIYNGE